jgi:hypothetical protein
MFSYQIGGCKLKWFIRKHIISLSAFFQRSEYTKSEANEVTCFLITDSRIGISFNSRGCLMSSDNSQMASRIHLCPLLDCSRRSAPFDPDCYPRFRFHWFGSQTDIEGQSLGSKIGTQWTSQRWRNTRRRPSEPRDHTSRNSRPIRSTTRDRPHRRPRRSSGKRTRRRRRNMSD